MSQYPSLHLGLAPHLPLQYSTLPHTLPFPTPHLSPHLTSFRTSPHTSPRPAPHLPCTSPCVAPHPAPLTNSPRSSPRSSLRTLAATRLHVTMRLTPHLAPHVAPRPHCLFFMNTKGNFEKNALLGPNNVSSKLSINLSQVKSNSHDLLLNFVDRLVKNLINALLD
jgi:hypothetical protein